MDSSEFKIKGAGLANIYKLFKSKHTRTKPPTLRGIIYKLQSPASHKGRTEKKRPDHKGPIYKLQRHIHKLRASNQQGPNKLKHQCNL